MRVCWCVREFEPTPTILPLTLVTGFVGESVSVRAHVPSHMLVLTNVSIRFCTDREELNKALKEKYGVSLDEFLLV